MNPSIKNTVWNGNARTALAPAASNQANQGALIDEDVCLDETDVTLLGRLDEPDAKYTRPPAKGTVALFDHKQVGKPMGVRPTTPVGGQGAAGEQTFAVAVVEVPLDQQMAQLALTDKASVESVPATTAAA